MPSRLCSTGVLSDLTTTLQANQCVLFSASANPARACYRCTKLPNQERQPEGVRRGHRVRRRGETGIGISAVRKQIHF